MQTITLVWIHQMTIRRLFIFLGCFLSKPHIANDVSMLMIFFLYLTHTTTPYLQTTPILFISDICVCGNFISGIYVCGNPFIIHHHSLLPIWFIQTRRISHRVVISEDEHVVPPYHRRQMWMHA